MLVYRIEHLNGKGPFSDMYVGELYHNFTRRHAYMLAPDETGYCMQLNDFCAYRSLETLKEFCKAEELEYLCELGFSVYEIELAKSQHEDAHQVVFQKSAEKTRKDVTQVILDAWWLGL